MSNTLGGISGGTIVGSGTGAGNIGSTTVSGGGISDSGHETSLGGVTSSSNKEISKITLPGGSTYSLKDEEARNSITTLNNRVSGVVNGMPLEIFTNASHTNMGETSITITPGTFTSIRLYYDLTIPIYLADPTDEETISEYNFLIMNRTSATRTFTFDIEDLPGGLFWNEDTYKRNDVPTSIDAHSIIWITIKYIDGNFIGELHTAH